MPGKLHYYQMGGQSHSIRALLHLANFQYEDYRIPFAEFANHKDNYPFGEVPCWEEDGIMLNQSNAILRVLGIRLGYFTEDPMIAYNIDSLIEYMGGMQQKMISYMLPNVKGGAALDPAAADKWCADFWDQALPLLEARLAGHGKTYIGGTDRVTIADLKSCQCLLSTVWNPTTPIPSSVIDMLNQKFTQYPNFNRWAQNMRQVLDSYINSTTHGPL